jgi:hypothetical protein
MDPASRALNLFEKGKYLNVSQAAHGTNVPRSTLRDRRNGIPPLAYRTTKINRLTLYQEAVLVAYIRDLQLQYAPINQATIRAMATSLARQNEPDAELGINWVGRFIKRHSELSTGRNRSFEKSRVEAAIPGQLKRWYEHINEVVQRFHIHPEDIWNFDEIGYQLGHSQKEMVVFDRRTEPPISIVSGSTG